MKASLSVHLKLLGMAVLWGGSWPAGKIMAQNLPPFAASAVRFFVSILFLFAWLLFLRKDGWASLRQLSARQWQGLALGGLIGVFGYATFFMYSLTMVPAGRASLVVALNPVMTTLMAAWVFKERFNWKIALGMVLAALGATVVLTRGEPLKLLVGGVGLGELLLLGCVTCWMIYTLIGRKLLAGIDALTATSVAALVGCVLLSIASLVVDGPNAVAVASSWSLGVWSTLLFLTLGATVLAYAWFFEGVATLGAGGASAYISLVPVFGVLLSTLWLGESIDSSLALGGVMAVLGMVVMNQARR